MRKGVTAGRWICERPGWTQGTLERQWELGWSPALVDEAARLVGPRPEIGPVLHAGYIIIVTEQASRAMASIPLCIRARSGKSPTNLCVSS